MQLTSPAFQHNASIPALYTCDERNISPPLQLVNVPQDAKSLALIVDDPDAPGGDFVHWTVWNIPPSINALQAGATPTGITEGMTDFGKSGYGGPCPPSGVHRYQFKLYALDTTLSLGPSATKRDLEAAMEGRILAQTLLVGTYQRKS